MACKYGLTTNIKIWFVSSELEHQGKHILLNGDTRQVEDVNFVLKFMGHIRIKFTQNMACVVFMSKRRNHTNFYIYIFFEGVGLQIAIQIILLIICKLTNHFD